MQEKHPFGVLGTGSLWFSCPTVRRATTQTVNEFESKGQQVVPRESSVLRVVVVYLWTADSPQRSCGLQAVALSELRLYNCTMPEPEEQSDLTAVLDTINQLALDKRVDVFRRLSASGREELLRSVHRPQDIVRKISEEEIYFTVKELGEEHAPALIAATTGTQLRYFLDVDAWKKDMFHIGSAARWLKVIAEIGEEKLLHYVQTVEPTFVAATLHRLIKVKIRNPDVDLVEQLDELPGVTLDDIFFIEFLHPDYEEPVRRLLEVVYNWNPNYYMQFMEKLCMGFQIEDEDGALKWRNARLADKGFPEFDEALEIYQYVQRSSVKDSDEEHPEVPEKGSVRTPPVLAYPLKVISGDSLFKRSLEAIDDSAETDRLATELAHLANKVMVADGKDSGRIEDLYASLRKVGGYINIALADTCGDDVSLAVPVLKANHMEILFRRGFSLILDLRKDVQKLIRDREGGQENLGYPLAGLVKGLLQKRPYFAAHLMGDREPREFESVEDIHHFRKLMDREELEDRWEPM
jgi:hypothetical protein